MQQNGVNALKNTKSKRNMFEAVLRKGAPLVTSRADEREKYFVLFKCF